MILNLIRLMEQHYCHLAHLVPAISCFTKSLKVTFKINFIEIICQNPQSPKFLESMILSGLAGSLAGFLVNPMELAKLRM
jgi:hypothetical protein